MSAESEEIIRRYRICLAAYEGYILRDGDDHTFLKHNQVMIEAYKRLIALEEKEEETQWREHELFRRTSCILRG